MGTKTKNHYFLSDPETHSPLDLIAEAFVDVSDDLDPPSPEDLVEALEAFDVVFPGNGGQE